MEVLNQPLLVSPNDIPVAPGNGKNSIRALLVQLEFPLWKAAKSWGYSGHFGLEEGLHANNVETFILPAWGLVQPDSHLSWLSYAKELCHNQHFDQVWLWLVHCEYPKRFLEWVATLAPVRVGCLYESLSYTRDECRQNSKLETRREEVSQQMQGLTHIICSDECDATYIQEKGIAQAIWSPTFVPRRFVSDEYLPPPHSNAAFFGALYSKERRQWLEQTNLHTLLARPASPEDATSYPLHFDRLHQASLEYFKQKLPINKEVLRQYVDELRGIRQGAFAAWMNGLRQWNGIVNLPSFGKVYTSRVAESMAAGSPAIAWEVPNRPRNRGLFEEGKEILLYKGEKPDQLAQHLLDLQRIPGLARTLVGNAREKIRRYHTAEIRTWQILNWIETGIEPYYGESGVDGKLGDEVVSGSAQTDSQAFSMNPRDATDNCPSTAKGISILGDPQKEQPSVTPKRFNDPAMFDGKELVRSSRNKEGLGAMSTKQLNQRIQEDQFYTDLFVHSGSWSTPTPNTDETLRWEKIKTFLPDIIKQLEKALVQPIRILDVGCGRGWLTNLLSDYGYCEGIEPVETVVKYGRVMFPNLTLHVGFPDVLLTREDFQPYDLIVTSEVIEHIPHVQKTKFVRTLQQLLQPNGAVILTTPRREVWEQWRSVSTPNQPIEDWITEPDLFDLFRERGFHELGRERIYFDLQKFQYVAAPPQGENSSSSTIIALYQIWAFGTGENFQDFQKHKSSLSDGGQSIQSFADTIVSIPANEHAVGPVISQDSELSARPRNPLVSVIVPTFNRRDTLKTALQSIIQQTFTDFEIIVINDAGVDVEDIVASFNTKNNVTSIRHGKNRGLAAARNSGLGVARGKYIAYLDDDDRYACNHLETLVSFLEESRYQVAYSDAWQICQRKEQGEYIEIQRNVPYSLDFNRDMLLINNCFPVLCMMHEKACLEKTGVFDETLTTHEDWDLWIRLSRHFGFAHLKDVTAEFTWRMDGSSMTSRIPTDFLRTKRLIYEKYDEYFRLQPHLIPLKDQELRNLESRVNPQPFECSIIIPVFNKLELTQQCLMHLAEVTTGISYEVVIVDNYSTDGTCEFLETLGGDVQIIRNDTNLGFAKGCNQGARAARGRHLVFLNNDTIPKSGWLDPLIEEVTSHADVAVVGSKLLYQDNTIQHAGVVISRRYRTPYHLFCGVPENSPAVNTRREFQAVTAACMLVRKAIFEEVGGFDEGFVNGFEDVDLCLKIRQLGKKVIYQPQSCLYHLESQTPGRKTHDEANAHRLLARWEHQWWVDEDLVAYQNGYIIQQSLSEVKFQTKMVPINMVADSARWERVVELQKILLGQICQPLAQMADNQKIRKLLVHVEAWPKDLGLLEWVGRVCETLQCEQEAVQFWEQLLTLGDHPNARLGLARGYLKARKFEEAQKHLDVLNRKFNPRSEGWLLQGILSMQRQNYAEAKQAFGQSLGIDPENIKARMGLGMACMGLELPVEAWNVFEKVVAVDPDHAEAMRCLIQTGTILERWDALAERLTRFIERNPADCEVRFALAGVLFRAGYLEKAKEHLTWLLLVQPDFEGLEDLERVLAIPQAQSNLVSVR